MAKYKAYPEYKDSGVEWLKSIPAHWECAIKYLALLLILLMATGNEQCSFIMVTKYYPMGFK
jgi:type I restriction enzyme S subunit